MPFIHPICEEKLGPYVGQPVCAILHDGTYYYGICGGVRDGKLILNHNVKGAGSLSISAKKNKQRVRIDNKAKVSGLGFPGFGFGGGGFGGLGGLGSLGGIGRFGGLIGRGLGLGLGLVSLLFALPFFGSGFFI
ncbi:MAG TPA: hypothetical protein VMS09_18535 [Paenibacillus sp.]|uniref:hypothetical protein n=1 Tax=Paenibacillus sp. TaxID=58172 RepID=UPI002C2E5E8A|nr:hypothetical protein [Paenibacillus sp.]HUC93984.1 hypothetical protein [Paenibacillus sp.]